MAKKQPSGAEEPGGIFESVQILNILKEPLQLKRLTQIKKKIYTRISEPEVYFSYSKEPVSPENRYSLEYKKIRKGEIWGKVYDCAWFKIIGSVPPQNLKSHLVLNINIGGEGLVFKGNIPVCAISHIADPSDFLSAAQGKTIIELNDFINDGSFEIHLDAGFNGQVMTLPMGRGIFRYARVCTVNDTVKDFYYDYLTVAVLLSVTEENEEKSFLKNALDRAFKYFEKNLAEKAREALLPVLEGKPSEDFEITAVGHSHLDLAWLWPVRETKRKSVRTFVNQLNNIKKYPGYVYGASQPWQFQQIKNTYPDLFEEIKKQVKNGFIELQGGMWVEADTNLSGGEALIRQLYYGKKFFKDEFGEDVKTCWLPDVFGYNGNLPQILIKSGIPYFMTIKLSWNEHNKFPYRSFVWQGIDSSSVLVHMPPDETYNSCGSPACAKHIVKNYPERDITKTALAVYGVGDGGGGPGEAHNEFVKRQASLRNSPKMIRGKASDFFYKLSKYREQLPVYTGELYLEKHQGTYTTQGRNKRFNRLGEYALQNIEALGAAAYLKGYEYPEEDIDRWWKEILLYQFHDIIPGSSVTRVYTESRERYRVILSEIAGKRDEILRFLSGKGEKEIFYNPSPFKVTEITPGGKVTAEPYSFAAPEKYKENISLTASGNMISNGILTLKFNNDGEIISLTDDQGNEHSGAYLNRLTLYSDPFKFYNAWDIDREYYKKKKEVLKAANFEIIKTKEKITRRNIYIHGKTEIIEDITLKAGSDVAEIGVKCDFYETFKMLRADFMPNIVFDKVKCDIQMGTIVRSAKDETSAEKAQFEICAHKYTDVSDGRKGLSVMSDCKYGYRVKSPLISLNLLRSPVYPDKTADRGKHEFTYALYPHKGELSAETLKRAYALNKPLIPFKGKNIPGSLAFVSNENIVIETIKKAYGREGVVIRLYESQGTAEKTSLKVNFKYKKAYEVNLTEENPRETKIKELSFTPFEIKTILLTL